MELFRFLSLSLFLVVPEFVVSSPVQRQIGPLEPTNDTFYTPPAGFESSAPGTILRHRPVPYPIAVFDVAPINIAGSHQLLYRTTDSFGHAIAAVSTILIPYNADNTKLLSYQVAEDAAYANCAPSYALQLKAAISSTIGTLITQIELISIEAALERGWTVTIPDSLGPKAAFLANNLAGRVVLDGIRAALVSSNFTGLASDPTVTMWGYSGGSLASGFAAELQPSYAPELKIAGAALGGTVPQILPVINAVNKGAFTGLIPSGVQGLSNEYPEIADLLDQSILPEKREAFDKVHTQCFITDIVQFLDEDIYTYVNDSKVFTGPTATAVLNDNRMGQHVPTIPLFVYKSQNDEVSPVANTDDLVTSYCNAGAQVTYKRDILSEHGILAITGVPEALIWLQDRMSGVPVASGCSTTTALTGLSEPGALAVLSQNLIDVLLDILQKPVGPVAIG